MPLFLSEAHGWSPAEYGSFYIAWGLVGVPGIVGAGWIIDRFGRRLGFLLMLAEGALFITLWVYADTKIELWVYGLLWSIGFLGIWGPATTYTTEMYPTRIRGIGNGFSWALAFLIGYVLWPFVTVWMRESTGSWNIAFLMIPAFMLVHGRGGLVLQPGECGQGSGRHPHLTGSVSARARVRSRFAPKVLGLAARAAAVAGGDILVVAGAGAEVVAKLVIASTEPLSGREAHEGRHTSNTAFHAAMILFQPVIFVSAGAVDNAPAECRADRPR
jgi:MFS family permease